MTFTFTPYTVHRPFFDSTGIDLTKGIVTNITCAVNFTGSASLQMKITDANKVVRSETVQDFTALGQHAYNLTYFLTVHITQDRHHYSVSPDVDIQSAFSCIIAMVGTSFNYTVNCEVDGNSFKWMKIYVRGI